MLEQPPAESGLLAELVDEADGRYQLDQGEASALLVIPEGFAEAVLREEPTTLELVTNPAQRIGPGIVEESLELLRDAVFYAHRLMGPEIREMVHGPPQGETAFSDQTIARMSVSINERIQHMSRYLSPRVLDLQTAVPEVEESEPPRSPDFPFSFYFLPGMLLMGLLFAAQGLSDDVWKERESGTLRRIVSTPLGISRFLVCKVMACAVVLTGIASIVLSAGFWYFELPGQRFPLALLWSAGTGVLLTGLMLPVQLSPRATGAHRC